MSNDGDGPGAILAGGSVGSGVSSGGMVEPDGGGLVGTTAMSLGEGCGLSHGPRVRSHGSRFRSFTDS
jgi:hypothetical protein